MTQHEVKQLVEAIAFTIGDWRDGYQLRASFANDGDGHFDFMGFKVLPAGIEELTELLRPLQES